MTLFVGGVHAVGKTFVLKPVCEGLGVRHATASQLIREQRGLANWTVSRQVDDIDENQQALVAAVRRLDECGETVVLDGHFVLRRGVNVHEKIGGETYAQLMVRGVILLEAPSATIADRLLQRGDRTWTLAEIEVFAQMELEHAEVVCRQLGVSLVRLCLPTELEVQDAVTKFLA
jgi:adenylate kinase